jgi:HEAT repeat protein/YHS domain-containing protein
MTPCPVCGKPVDPLRAPAVSVRDGKVVAFCSKECRAQAETQPTKIQPTKIVRMPTGEGPTVARTQTPEKARTPSTGVPKSAADLDSGPVIEIVREPEESTPVVVEPTKKRKRPPTDSAIQIADTGRVDDYIAYSEGEGGGRKVLVVLVILLVLVGGAAAAYKLGYLDRFLKKPSRTPTFLDAAVVMAPLDAPAAPIMTPELALDEAKAVLIMQFASGSPRVQRVAASALARTGDQAALDFLASAIATESSDIAKLDMAYALARSGDKRGTDALVAAMNSGKRDPKLEAGRRFALLGDKRAVNVLASYLTVSQHRLGTAEQLAYLADPTAIEVLDKALADGTANTDEKARAAIALGHAGRTDIAPQLRALLTDDRQNAFAAQALANLHDEAARPVLVSQLGIPSLRVASARALRRLAPDADVSALLPPLVDALESKKDTEQVQIAEAVLLLAGPASWSERE